jgi:uncharacterized protein YbjT (DUF2867 family)
VKRKPRPAKGSYRTAGLDWTIVRASWFNQNFSEGAFIEMVLRQDYPAAMCRQVEPFVDVDDIADVVVAALTTHPTGRSTR